MQLFIVAGGTGGHFYPGLAVARACLAKGDSVHFIVRHKDYVITFLNREKISYSCIAAGGLERRFHPKNIWTLIKLIFGFLESFFILINDRPDCILVMGGYLSVPPALAAKLLGIPVVLHEQNAKPGLANRMIAKLTKHVALSFESGRPYFKGNPTLTGNPVREEFKAIPKREDSLPTWNLSASAKTLLIFGGSLGAHRLNELVIEAAGRLKEEGRSFQFLHFTGRDDQKAIEGEYEKLNVPHYVADYCHEMAYAYSAADLVFCRAGASTVTELIAAKKPAIVVPYPFATGGHQRVNADILAKAGACEIYEQKDLDGEKLSHVLKEYLRDPEKLSRMKQSYDVVPNLGFEAATNIRNLLVEVTK